MSKLFTLGVVLSAKDMLSPIIGKTVDRFSDMNDKAKELQESIGGLDKTSAKATMALRGIDEELKELAKRKLKLREEFKSGAINAELFQRKMRSIENIERSLNSRRLKLHEELKKSVYEANRLDRELRSIERRKKAINALASFGKGATIVGTALTGAGLMTRSMSRTPIESFAELEEAQTQLKITLMDAQGEVGKWFNMINKQAIELGNKLPGTTADFYKIAIALKSLGIGAESIAGGVLKSAAYLAVALKGMGVSYEEAAVATAKFREAMGIADKDLLKFIDLIQRTAYTGVRLEEMKYAFSKVGATLKGLGISGYEAAQKITPLIGMLIKAGFSGESVGTNLGNVIQAAMKFEGSKAQKMALRYGIDLRFTDADGKFLGIEHLVKELEKLKEIADDTQRLKIIEKIFGSGEAANMANVLIRNGVEGYKAYQKQLANQADINRKVEASLKTLNALWEAFTGTLTNVFAIVGEQVAPALKWLTEQLNDFADWLTTISKEFPGTTKWISIVVVGLSALVTVLGAASIAFGIAAKGLSMLFAVVKLSPLGLIVSGLLAAGWALKWAYEKFEWFRNFVDKTWSGIKSIFSFSPFGAVVKAWQPLFDWLYNRFEWFRKFTDSIVSVGVKIKNWLFGEDDKRTKVGKAVKNITVGAAVATSAAIGADNMHNRFQVAQPQPSQQKRIVKHETNHYTINVHVKSDARPEEIARAVQKALQQRRQRSFEDDE